MARRVLFWLGVWLTVHGASLFAECFFTLERAHGRKMDFLPLSSYGPKQGQHSKETGGRGGRGRPAPSSSANSSSGAPLPSTTSVPSSSFLKKGRRMKKGNSSPERDVNSGGGGGTVRFMENQFPSSSSPSVDAKLDHVGAAAAATVVVAVTPASSTSTFSALEGGQAKTWTKTEEVKKKTQRLRHLELKFRDLPPWRRQHPSSRRMKRKERTRAGKAAHPPRLTFDPLYIHMLAQDFSYPDSNALTQADRDYFSMIRTENGRSDFHFLRGGGEGKDGDDRINQGRTRITLSPLTNESHSRLEDPAGAGEGMKAAAVKKKEVPPSSNRTSEAETLTEKRSRGTRRPKFVYHRVSEPTRDVAAMSLISKQLPNRNWVQRRKTMKHNHPTSNT